MGRERLQKAEVTIEKGEILLTLDGGPLLCDLDAAEDLYEKLGRQISKLRSRKTRFERLNSREIVEKKASEPKMKDYEDKLVQLLFDVETKGGTKFKAGDVLKVYGHWRGCLHATDPNDPKRSIRRLNRHQVELLENSP